MYKTPATPDTTATTPATKAAAPKATPATKRDFTPLAKKDPTDLHKAFAAWLEAEVGVKVDLKTVQLVASLRHDFQASEANQKMLVARRTEAKKAEAAKLQAKRTKVLADAKALGLSVS